MHALPRVTAVAALITLAFFGTAAADAFDGRWIVIFGESTGECSGAFQDVVTVAGGRVAHSSNGASATGNVAPNGAVSGTIVIEDTRVVVTGRLADSVGGGTWRADGDVSCGGRWSARRG